MAANHPTSPGCGPPALMWAALATTRKLAWTGRASPHPLHPHHVLKRLLPQGSWHSIPEHICDATAHIRAHKACTQHGQTAPRFSGRSHFQYIFNTALTSTWSTPIKGFAGYVKRTQGTHCFRKQNLLLPSPPLLRKLLDNLLYQKREFYLTALPR